MADFNPQLNLEQQARMAEQQLFPVPDELPPPIPEGEQEELVKKLKYEYDEFENSVATLHKKLDDWHKLYDAMSDSKREFPWPDASDYTVPLIMSIIDSIHSRIVKSVFGVDPIILARPRTPEGVPLAEKAEWYMDYWFDRIDMPAQLDMLIHSMLLEGTGVLKLDWVRQTRKIPQQQFPNGPFGTAPGPSVVTEYDGPGAYHVPLKDFVLIPADSPTIDDAVYVGHRVFLTSQQLEVRRDEGYYFNVDKLLSKTEGDSTHDKTNHPSDLVNVSARGGQYPETNQFEVVELYGPYDFGDGPVPAYMTFSPKHDILLRVEPYPYEYERPPYIGFSVLPRVNLFFGRSFAEILESAQEELTALHNMRADAITRRIAPPLLRQFGSRWVPDEQPWKPGQVIDVNDPAEIIELELSDVPQGIFAHEQDIMAFTERVTGMNDAGMGRINNQYATATHVDQVTSSGLIRVDVMIQRFQQSMKQLAWHMWWLLYQYRPYMDTFFAQNATKTITKNEMRPTPTGLMPFEFIPHGMMSGASKEARRQQDIMLLNVAGPFLQQFYPDGLQTLLRKIFQDFDVQDRDQILGPSWNFIQQQLQQAMQEGYQQGVQDGASQSS